MRVTMHDARMGWLDRHPVVLYASIVVLHIAIVLLSVQIQQARVATEREGMGGLGTVAIIVVAITVVVPLLAIAVWGIVAPLVIFDVLGMWWAWSVPNAAEYGDLGSWQLLTVLFGLAALAGACLQVTGVRRWRKGHQTIL